MLLLATQGYALQQVELGKSTIQISQWRLQRIGSDSHIKFRIRFIGKIINEKILIRERRIKNLEHELILIKVPT